VRSPCPVHRACTLTAESTRQVLSLDRLVSRPSAGTDESHNFTKARYNVCESSTVLPSFRCHSLHTLYILDPFSPHWLYILDPFSPHWLYILDPFSPHWLYILDPFSPLVVHSRPFLVTFHALGL